MLQIVIVFYLHIYVFSKIKLCKREKMYKGKIDAACVGMYNNLQPGFPLFVQKLCEINRFCTKYDFAFTKYFACLP